MAADPNRAEVCKLRPHEASCAGARRPGRGSHDGRDRVRRDTSSRRGDLGFAAVHRAGPELLPHRGGQVRHRHGQGCARDHRDLRVPHLSDVRDAAHPKVLDTLQPPEVLGKNGYWQDEDMEIDTKRKLIIGALDPRHTDDVDQTSCPGIGRGSAGNRGLKSRSGFYVISYDNPRHLRQVGALRRGAGGPHTSCIDDCKLASTRRPGAAQRRALVGPDPEFERPAAVHLQPGRRRRPPIWVTDLTQSGEAAHVSIPADRHRAQRRLHRLLARRRRGRRRVSRG